jgi:hypothetical protein
MNYVFVEKMHPTGDVLTDEQMFLHHFVEIVWQGIAPIQD